jgi:hypothetical protein
MKLFNARYGSAFALFLALNTSAQVNMNTAPKKTSGGCTVSSFEPFDATSAPSGGTFATSINSKGEIVGTYFENGFDHGFVRGVSGRITAVNVPGEDNTFLVGINANGQIAGYSTFPRGLSFVRDEQGNFTTFREGFGLKPLSINDEGEIAGWNGQTAVPFGGASGFLRTKNGEITDINVPAATSSSGFDAGTIADSINNNGEIAGFFYNNEHNQAVPQGFIRARSGPITTFALTPTGSQFFAGNASINNKGQVAGDYHSTFNFTQGFFRDEAGQITTFNPPDAQTTVVTGINDQGYIVGYYAPNGTIIDDGLILVYRVFVRSPGGQISVFDAPGVTPPPTSPPGFGPLLGTFANSINERCEIAGHYTDADRHVHGFLAKLHCPAAP